ncbi:restriction endonuclease subunit S [Streptomyces sp. NPDC056491]|uniref:restriction endonuclease subunit S n=1 Tax=Streptomyces sp. NPDC056491 TaxID=3345837 RepID=UPI0036BB6CF0
MTWQTTKLKWAATTVGGGTPSVADPTNWADDEDGTAWVSISDMSGCSSVTSTNRRVTAKGIAEARLSIGEPGTLIMSMYASLGHTAFLATQASWNQAILGIYASPSHEPRFLKYALDAIKPTLREIARSNTQANLNAEQVGNLVVPEPPLEEQRRIADFLDAETARIDRLTRARQTQIDLLEQKLSQLIDGVVAGDPESLAKATTSAVNACHWVHTKVSRLCEVIPGYAFPSADFLDGTSGTRLLRGVNVAVGGVSWTDSVTWDTDANPVPDRFHLRPGALVMGMDRPWISSGMRIALLQESDTPSLLLQRVACLRPKSSSIRMGFVRWALRSSHFRLDVESEMTGVSVPHLSGEQIGGFTFLLPTVEEQKCLAESLEAYASRTRQLTSSMNQQIALLAERRQALITAAVTGQFDVSTASGRNVTDGVTA